MNIIKEYRVTVDTDEYIFNVIRIKSD